MILKSKIRLYLREYLSDIKQYFQFKIYLNIITNIIINKYSPKYTIKMDSSGIKIVSRPSIVNMAIKESQKSSGTHSIGAVITYGMNKPVMVGYNTNQRSVYRFGKNRMIACSQHAEMSVASKFLNRVRAGKMSRVRGNYAKVAKVAKVEKVSEIT